ncbi:MAG: LLM class flavin-dependent oxidoreductase [Thermobacillus sp.]|jgi:luciferase family oxidoreductase group 1|uniref:LLM class flavin-dependent oxidoreductase n=1 Tax=Thermobacillus sp. TaxID=2108467 RepID=UPI000E386D14|nr:LLM class flavin-dependent oxidoreductase [Thermobacillus sp.]REK56744.1 MAG: LLM class flavin-dependent oxidoreductase [Thermobacillus sp.]
MVTLSVFDQSALVSGMTPYEAMRNTLALAEAADRLGYARFWVSEHHDTDGLAGSAPEIVMAAVLARTRRIRVGSAAVLLQHYSPYKIAEQFRVLEAMFPGRVDLGIGRSSGGKPPSAAALQYGAGSDATFERRLIDLAGFLRDDLPADHPYAGVRARPSIPTVPEIWLLGSGTQSAELASQLGASFAYAHFFKGIPGHDAIRNYRDRFRPGPLGDKPRTAVCTVVICAETDEEAEQLAAPVDLRMLLIDKGEFARPYLTPEEADAYPYSEEDRERIRANRTRMIVGGPDKVRRDIERFCREYGADELIVLTMLHDFDARLRSYELLAEAMGINV